MRALSLALIANITFPALAFSQSPANHIQAQEEWTVLAKARTREEFLLFRRYAYTRDGIPNLLIFNCSKEPERSFSHLTIIVPPSFKVASFNRDAWLPSLEVRFLVNGRSTHGAKVEYRKSEIYFDLTPETSALFARLLSARTLSIGFGAKNDILSFEFTPKMDKLMREPVITSSLGAIQLMSTAAVVEECKNHQRG